jgi:hypothetical protein
LILVFIIRIIKKALLAGLPKGLIVGTIKKIKSFTFGYSKAGCTSASYNTLSFYLLLVSSVYFYLLL